MEKIVRFFSKLALLFPIVVCCYCVYELRSLRKKVTNFQNKSITLLQKHEALTQGLQIAFEQQFHSGRLPLQIKHLPFADEEGVVLSVRPLPIPGVIAPHNGSLVERGDHYLLFFRYDTPVVGKEEVPYYSHIGCLEMDRNFAPLAPYFTVDTQSSFSEDPRGVCVDGSYYVVYNDSIPNMWKKRGIRVANIDLETKKTRSILQFERKRFSTEKNWMPFFPDGKNLHFVYTISPHDIYRLKTPGQSSLAKVVDLKEVPELSSSDWPEKWGVPRGGTPPRLVDGEYLSFFHSSFEDMRGVVWYIMGAYTFEPTAPYRITKISRYPILFKGIYDTPHENTSNPKVRCIYPAGFVLDNRDGKELIQLSCGENDSAIKILPLDKKKLMESLGSVP